MTNHQELHQMKTELMDIWIENLSSTNTFEEWFDLLSPYLQVYFNIEKANLLLFDGDCFLPMKWNYSIEKKWISISLSEVEETLTVEPESFISRLNELGFDYVDDVLFIKSTNSQPLCILILQSTERWKQFSESFVMDEFKGFLSKLFEMVKKTLSIVKQEKMYKDLFSMTELFHSTMNMDIILEGILESVVSSVPFSKGELILSIDQNYKSSNYIRSFHYSSERNSTVEAFLNGIMTTEQSSELQCRVLNVPIKGKQATYGVLQIVAPYNFHFSESQKSYLSMLAKTAGIALENAKLYQQSYRLNADLQLINETSRKLNMNFKLEEMPTFLLKQFNKAIHPKEVGFFLLDEEENYHIALGTTDFFNSDQSKEYIEYAISHFRNSTDPIFEADISQKGLRSVPYLSYMAFPLVDQHTVLGFSIVLHEEPYYFSFDSFKLMQSLTHHSALAIINFKLRDKLQELVNKDYLTKLYSRKYFDGYFLQTFNTVDRGVYMILDVDHFKSVNDTYGHQTGDGVLVQIAKFLQQQLVDKGIGVRWGGEEIVVYLPSFSLNDGEKFASEIVTKIPKVTSPSVTVSIGLAYWNKENYVTKQQLFQQADIALYKAKDKGRNQLQIYRFIRA